MGVPVPLDVLIDYLRDVGEALVGRTAIGIGKVSIFYPNWEDNTEVEIRNHFVTANALQSALIIVERGAVVNWRDFKRNTWQTNWDLLMMYMRPWENGETPQQEWRRDYEYVLNEYNKEATTVPTGYSGTLIGKWRPTETEPRTISGQNFFHAAFVTQLENQPRKT